MVLLRGENIPSEQISITVYNDSSALDKDKINIVGTLSH